MVLSLAFQYQLEGKNVHLIGHSLGAHVMGLAGEKLKDDKFIVARVTGKLLTDFRKELFNSTVCYLLNHIGTYTHE